MTSKTRAVLSVLLGVVMALSVTPATAQTAKLDVVALGDSYASGVGAGNYDPGSGSCARSTNAYGEVAARRLSEAGKLASFTNATCSGATTASVRQTQLDVLSAETDLVLLTVGGNDAGLIQYGSMCVNPEPNAPDCSGPPTYTVLAQLLIVKGNVTSLVRDIAERAPHAKIVMVGYGELLDPTVVSTNADPICAQFTPKEREAGWAVEGFLDGALRRGVEKAGVGAGYLSPYTFPFVPRPEFATHSLCDSGVPWYNGFNALPDTSAVLHATREWHAAVANMLKLT